MVFISASVLPNTNLNYITSALSHYHCYFLLLLICYGAEMSVEWSKASSNDVKSSFILFRNLNIPKVYIGRLYNTITKCVFFLFLLFLQSGFYGRNHGRTPPAIHAHQSVAAVPRCVGNGSSVGSRRCSHADGEGPQRTRPTADGFLGRQWPATAASGSPTNTAATPPATAATTTTATLEEPIGVIVPAVHELFGCCRHCRRDVAIVLARSCRRRNDPSSALLVAILRPQPPVGLALRFGRWLPLHRSGWTGIVA